MSQKNGVVISKAAKMEAAKRNAVVKTKSKMHVAIVKNHDARNGEAKNGKAANGNGKPASGKAPEAAKPQAVAVREARVSSPLVKAGEVRIVASSVPVLKAIARMASKKGGVWVKDLHDALTKEGVNSEATGRATYYLCGKGLIAWSEYPADDKKLACSFHVTDAGRKILAALGKQ